MEPRIQYVHGQSGSVCSTASSQSIDEITCASTSSLPTWRRICTPPSPMMTTRPTTLRQRLLGTEHVQFKFSPSPSPSPSGAAGSKRSRLWLRCRIPDRGVLCMTTSSSLSSECSELGREP